MFGRSYFLFASFPPSLGFKNNGKVQDLISMSHVHDILTVNSLTDES